MLEFIRIPESRSGGFRSGVKSFFNNPGHDEYRSERTIVANSAWSPDGSSLVICVTYAHESDPKKFSHLAIGLQTPHQDRIVCDNSHVP